MSRLGDMIYQQRVKSGMTAKAVAKRCGVSESFLLEVEQGKRIINDAAAVRILKAMGGKADAVNDFETRTVPDAPAAQPVSRPAPAAPLKPATPSAAWQDALGGVMKSVPILDGNGKTVGHRTLPIENGKVEGAHPEKVYFLNCADNSMSGYRLRAGDCLLVVPTAHPVDGATMIVEEDGVRVPRRVTIMAQERVLLQWYEQEPCSKAVPIKSVTWHGRAVYSLMRL